VGVDTSHFRKQFIADLMDRWDAGALEYKNKSFEGSITTSLDEQYEEALDIAGWALPIAYKIVALRERADRSEQDLEDAMDELSQLYSEIEIRKTELAQLKVLQIKSLD